MYGINVGTNHFGLSLVLLNNGLLAGLLAAGCILASVSDYICTCLGKA